MIQGIHHFAIIVSSEDGVAFYERLGFEIFKRVTRKHDTVVLLSGYGIQIEMFVDASHSARSVPDPLGLRHLALRVEDIEKTSKELGLEIGPIQNDWMGVRFGFITDPDGNVIELHE